MLVVPAAMLHKSELARRRFNISEFRPGQALAIRNVLAGIGRGQLTVIDERVRQRRAVAFRYRDAFADVPGITLIPQSELGLHTNWLSVFTVDTSRFGA